MWNNSGHRQRLKEASFEFRTDFIRFVNLLKNDATFLLDESITKLQNIRKIQDEMDRSNWNTRPSSERQEREAVLRSDERMVASWLGLGNETMEMLKNMTALIPEPFLEPEVVNLLAMMLDFNLDKLVGPECSELKVKEPEKYHFQPKKLLRDLIQVYLNLDNRSMIQAVAADERSYRRSHFSRAASILRKLSMISEVKIEFLNTIGFCFRMI